MQSNCKTRSSNVATKKVHRSSNSHKPTVQMAGIKKINRQQYLVGKEIYKYQHETGFLLRKLPFARVIKSIIEEQRGVLDYRIQAEAIDALLTATEHFLVDLLATSQLCAEHGKRVTLMDRDVILTCRIRKLFVLPGLV